VEGPRDREGTRGREGEEGRKREGAMRKGEKDRNEVRKMKWTRFYTIHHHHHHPFIRH